MLASRTVTLAALILLQATLPVAAWAPETRVRMVEEAVRLMPATLRVALEGHREDLLAGMLTPLLEEDDPRHLANWNHGSLDLSVELAAGELSTALERPDPFATIARKFGELAHFVADAGFPPGVGEGDTAGRYGHFAAFCESRRERFPLVFYGHDSSELEQGDFRGFALGMTRRAADLDRQLARAYAAAGDPPPPAAFDDRSVPFAVGSLAYSHTVTDVVRAWLSVWRRAGGDMGRTPYLSSDRSE